MPKPETVSITIYPSTAESADLTVADAMQQVLDAFELLSKSQLGRTGEPKSKVIWRLEKASTNSPLTIEASASSYDPAINLDVEARQAKIAFFEGVNGLLAAKKKPDWMDKDAETTVRRLFARNLNGIGRTDFVFEEGAAPVIVDHRTAARAVNFLERLAAEEAAKIVLTRLSAANTTREALPVLRALLNRADGSAALQKALRAPDALSPAGARIGLQALNGLGRSDPKLSGLLMKLAGLNPALPAYTKDYIARIVRDAQTRGDAAEGKKIYEQAGCAACHAIGGVGGTIGPDLSALSRGLPIDMIVTEVVWPALNVKEGFEAATVTLRDGSVIAGFTQTAAADSIAIRDMTTREVRTINRSEATLIQTGGTVMPDGATALLNELQFAHLVRYLSELGK